MDETTLQMVQRHVRRGEALVLRQRELVAKIIDAGRDPHQAESILTMLEDAQDQHVAHLERITD